jgi:oxygen-independent coproporphyrinogen-3 oxidase
MDKKPNVDTIFFGGGTPGLLTPDQLEQIFITIEQNFNFSPVREITLETNPGTVDRGKLQAFHALGVNRLSMGVQSFRDEDLRFLGRIHDAKTAVQSVHLADSVGFEKINIDIMTAFQGQSPEDMLFNLRTAVQLPLTHISVYTLILEKNTPFYRKFEQGKLQILSDEEERMYYEQTMNFLQKHQFIHYEVSNFYRQDSVPCYHNLNYWTGKPYLGLGPSAHSYLHPYRWGNVRNLSEYLKRIHDRKFPVSFKEKLSIHEYRLEYLFLHLRLREGFSLSEYAQLFHDSFTETYARQIRELVEENLAVLENDRFYLTDRGILLAEEIVLRF